MEEAQVIYYGNSFEDFNSRLLKSDLVNYPDLYLAIKRGSSGCSQNTSFVKVIDAIYIQQKTIDSVDQINIGDFSELI